MHVLDIKITNYSKLSDQGINTKQGVSFQLFFEISNNREYSPSLFFQSKRSSKEYVSSISGSGISDKYDDKNLL